MKLLYTLAAVFMTVSASAAINSADFSAKALNVKAEYAGQVSATADFGNVATPKTGAVTFQLPANATPVTKASSKKVSASDVEKWNSLGNVTFTEKFVGFFFTAVGTTTSECEIQEAEGYPGYFRLVNPFLGVKNTIGGSYSGSAARPKYMYINATNPDEVWIEVMATGYTANSTYGEFYVMSYNGLMYNNGKDVDDTKWGTYADNEITFPEKSLLVGMTKYNDLGLYFVDGTDFRVAFPGAKDYSITVSADGCAADNNIKVTVLSGADVATVMYALAPGEYPIVDEMFQIVPHMGYTLQGGTSGTFVLPMDGADAGRYTLFIAALDEEGNYHSGDGTFFYVLDNNDEDWAKVADVMYGDVFIGSQYKLGYTEFEVELQENINTPGYYRIVDPYNNDNFTGKANNNHATDHAHYIYLDATDPDNVILEEGPIGADWGYGAMCVSSDSCDPENPTNFGTLASYDDNNKRITFPAGSLKFFEQGYNKGYKFSCTSNDGDFYVEVPKAQQETILDDTQAEFVTIPEEGVTENDSFELPTTSAIGTAITYTIANEQLAEDAARVRAREEGEEKHVATLVTDDETGAVSLVVSNPGEFDLVAEAAGNDDYAPAQTVQHVVIAKVASGVENVAVDNTNGKVVYFNLQGQRIANPAAGQTVIVRNGNNAAKMIVR